MHFIKILVISAVIFSLCPLSLCFAEDSAYSHVDGNPFVKKNPSDDFKLPSAVDHQKNEFKGFDYEKSRQFYDKLNIKNETMPYSPYQKSKAFDGSEAEYNREFGTRDSLKKFKEIEEDLLNKEKDTK
ncbi:MAG: hypothetical protein LBE27_07000 [Deltaproteobacteria bacterium]|jgi:hypothetical protein|nr:hypothetical protein [Deltaproteobacteria bacterium]